MTLVTLGTFNSNGMKISWRISIQQIFVGVVRTHFIRCLSHRMFKFSLRNRSSQTVVFVHVVIISVHAFLCTFFYCPHVCSQVYIVNKLSFKQRLVRCGLQSKTLEHFYYYMFDSCQQCLQLLQEKRCSKEHCPTFSFLFPFLVCTLPRALYASDMYCCL